MLFIEKSIYVAINHPTLIFTILFRGVGIPPTRYDLEILYEIHDVGIIV